MRGVGSGLTWAGSRLTLSECGKGKARVEGRFKDRRTALLLLAREFPGHVVGLALLALMSGALPAVFAVLVARLIVALPAAVTGEPDLHAGIVVILVGVGVVLVAQELVSSGYEVARWALYRRYEEYLLARVMRQTLDAPLSMFETPLLAQKADRAVRIAALEPGDLVDGYTTKWVVGARGLAATVLVATAWPVAAVAIALVWWAIRRRVQANGLRGATDTRERDAHHADYYRRMGQGGEWAKEVRIFGLASWLSDRFALHRGRFVQAMITARKVDRRTMGLLSGLMVIANAGVVGMASWSAFTGRLGVSELVVLVQGLLGMALLADQSGDNLVEYGASRLRTILDLESALGSAVAVATQGAVRTRSAAGLPMHEIRFNGVRFGYPGADRPVFDGLDLCIEAGTSVGIVGLNGAGKTTLIKLLTGLETPQAGQITVDGIAITELEPDSWRRSIAAIFQDFVRYELSARDNIGFGAIDELHADDVDRRVTTAANRTGADTVLTGLADGLDTTLSRRFPGGTDLSGGQWQRIALARAMTAVSGGARVLVLDEPTAQLDVRAEADIYDRFLDMTQDLTSIVISHRFSTVRRADRIVVLDAGRVSESGSHAELIIRGGTYARLFATQAMRYADRGRDDG